MVALAGVNMFMNIPLIMVSICNLLIERFMSFEAVPH